MAALAGGWLPAASATGFRRLAPSVVAFWSDGTRYVVWQTQRNSAVVVYDTLTRHKEELALPPGCFPDEAIAGRFLLNCTVTQQLLNLQSGAITTLPTGPFNVAWEGGNSRYIEGFADKTACRETSREIARRRPCLALDDLATGAVTYRPLSQVGDLDRPGAPPVCPKLRRNVIDGLEEKGEAEYDHGVLAELIYVGERTPNRIRLTHCHGHPTVVHTLTGHNFPEGLDLSAGIITWDSGHPSTNFFDAESSGENVETGVLWSYDIATRHRQKWTLPRTRLTGNAGLEDGRSRLGVLGESRHTKYAVFWLATRTVTCDKLCDIASWSVYIAPR